MKVKVNSLSTYGPYKFVAPTQTTVTRPVSIFLLTQGRRVGVVRSPFFVLNAPLSDGPGEEDSPFRRDVIKDRAVVT